MRTGSWVCRAHQYIHELIVIVIGEGPLVNDFLFYLDWLKINVDFVQGSSELIIILLLPGIAPSNFSILTCSRTTRQPLRSETSESSLTPPFPSSPTVTSLKVRIDPVKCILLATCRSRISLFHAWISSVI